MKILNIVPYVGNVSAGPSYSVPRLCGAVAAVPGMKLTLHTLAPLPAAREEWNFAVQAWPRHRFPHPALGRSPEMRRGLQEACQTADIIHNHSLWMLPNIYPEFVRRGTRCKLVISPRGCLAPWALNRSRWKKCVSRMLGQYANLFRADMLHATCEKEYREIRAFGLKQPVLILPNGVDLPPEIPRTSGERRKLLFLGRLHPVKGIENLLAAWRALAEDHPDWELHIVGPGEPAYTAGLKVRAARLPRVEFHGEARGDMRNAEYSGADLYVLPSYTENFGMTVAEALSCKTPVVTTDGTPWTELPAHHAGWCVPVGAETLIPALREALDTPREELAAMGEAGRRWMEQDFNWNVIGRRTAAAYRWLVEGGEKPAWIRVD